MIHDSYCPYGPMQRQGKRMTHLAHRKIHEESAKACHFDPFLPVQVVNGQNGHPNWTLPTLNLHHGGSFCCPSPLAALAVQRPRKDQSPAPEAGKWMALMAPTFSYTTSVVLLPRFSGKNPPKGSGEGACLGMGIAQNCNLKPIGCRGSLFFDKPTAQLSSS